MNTAIVQEPQRDMQIKMDSENAEMQIPDHAIRRFARFLLPKMQEDLKRQKTAN